MNEHDVKGACLTWWKHYPIVYGYLIWVAFIEKKKGKSSLVVVVLH